MTDDGWLGLEEALVGVRHLTASQLAHAAGVDRQTCRRVWRAMGFVDAREDEALFSDRDVAVLRTIREVADSGILDMDGLLALTRATCHAQARVAEAQAQIVVERAASLNRNAQAPSAFDLAEQDPVVSAANVVFRHLEHFVDYTWRRHLLDALSREAAQIQHATVQMTVGFADLVGFTALSERSPPMELGALISRFEAVAYDVVVGGGGRVVKMIGDEVFFVVDSAQAGAAIALALVNVCSLDARLPDVRVGLSLGPVLSRGGDVLGRPVNLASRLVKIAGPGTTLVSEEFADALSHDEEWNLHRLPARLMKGIGLVPSAALSS